jgi:2-oxoacid dehydrogenases acyltransferase (catalytic domain)
MAGPAAARRTGSAARRSRRLHGWRKLAGSAWGPPNDPQFYGDLDLDATALLAYIDKVRRETGVHVTVTHLVGKAVARGLAEIPELRVRLARGREYQRESVDVFFIVSAEGGRELTGIKVSAADRKSVAGIGRELADRLQAIEAGRDPEFGRTKAMLATVPPSLLRYTLRAAAWLTSDLNLDLSRFGMPRQAFGGAMITSIGMWGVNRAYSPLARYYRVPVLMLVGAVRPQPVVIDGDVAVRPVLTLTATFDHRYADGFHAAKLAGVIKDYCSDPAAYDPPSPAASPSLPTDPAAGPDRAAAGGAAEPAAGPDRAAAGGAAEPAADPGGAAGG